MRALFGILLLSLMAGASAFARLGETEAQIETRYGKPLDATRVILDTATALIAPDGPAANALFQTWPTKTPGFEKQHYSFNGLNICVLFLNKKSVLEQYTKPQAAVLAASEAQQLLDANALLYNTPAFNHEAYLGFYYKWTKAANTELYMNLLSDDDSTTFLRLAHGNDLALAAFTHDAKVLTIIDRASCLHVKEFIERLKTGTEAPEESPAPQNLKGF